MISPVGNPQTGWGAVCGLHSNSHSPGLQCKRNLGYRGRGAGAPVLNDAECQRQLKRWLIAGLKIPASAVNGQEQHMLEPIRTLGPQTDPEDLGPVIPAPAQ
eukprot:7098239-Pyramimonas_sp.AAC.1